MTRLIPPLVIVRWVGHWLALHGDGPARLLFHR